MDKGAWWATVHGVTKSQTRLSDTATTMRGAFCPSFNQKSLQVLSLFLKIIMTSLFGTVIVYYSSLENKPKNQHKLIKIMAQGPHSHGVGPIKALPQCAHACAHLHGCASANTDTRGSRWDVSKLWGVCTGLLPCFGILGCPPCPIPMN